MLIIERTRFQQILLRYKPTGQVVATLTVTKVEGRRVKIGIDAIDSILIHRPEVDSDPFAANAAGEMVIEQTPPGDES